MFNRIYEQSHTKPVQSDTWSSMIFFAIFKASFRGMEKTGKKRERDIQFLLSIVIGGLEQLEPLSESEFN